MARHRSLVLAAVALVGCALLVISTSRADQGKSKPATGELTQAAQKALEQTQELYQTGRGTAEDVYRWSRRLMEAEQKADHNNRQAAAAHIDRMKALQDRVVAKAKAGVEGGEEANVAAAAYFVEEAKSE
jgi:hypothetical protein